MSNELPDIAHNEVVVSVDRERGRAVMRYAGRDFTWHLDRHNRPILIDQDERSIEQDVVRKMKEKVWAILGPELRSQAK